jgi:hypothetical protein
MNLTELGWDSMKQTDLAQDKDKWQALVDTMTNLQVPKNAGNFLTS